MPDVNQQKLLELSSFTSKLLRKNFGRGPESCHAYFNQPFLVFYIRGFLSPMETILLEKGNADNIEISRGIVMQSILTQLKGVIELELEHDVVDFYHDWNYPNNTGVIIVVFESQDRVTDYREQLTQYKVLIDEIERISNLVQKVPDKTEIYQVSPRIYLAKRMGILVPIEKALIAKGYQDTLLVTKDELEKKYYHRDGRFESFFNQPVADIFIDWNFQADNCMMCFVLK